MIIVWSVIVIFLLSRFDLIWSKPIQSVQKVYRFFIFLFVAILKFQHLKKFGAFERKKKRYNFWRSRKYIILGQSDMFITQNIISF